MKRSKIFLTKGTLIWKTEDDMQKELHQRINSRLKDGSNDGFIESATGEFVYRKIEYCIKVLRYFNHLNKFVSLQEGTRTSDSHVCVECPEKTELIKKLLPTDIYDDFLYHDTLHFHNDLQTLDQQIAEGHTLAKKDIDTLLDGVIGKTIDRKIKNLQKIKAKINKLKSK